MRSIPEEVAMDYARQAFEHNFKSGAQYDAFLSEMQPGDRKKFLYLGAVYLFLVKEGDWKINVEGSDRVIEYLTNSYKLVTLFSLIESLSTERYLDFYQWLNSKQRKNEYPLARDALHKKYSEYKADYGAVKKCKNFFEALPDREKKKLITSFKVKNGKPTIEEIATFLYTLRSKFVHEGKFILELGTMPHLVRKNGTYTLVSLSVEEFCKVFEAGVIEYFKGTKKTL